MTQTNEALNEGVQTTNTTSTTNQQQTNHAQVSPQKREPKRRPPPVRPTARRKLSLHQPMVTQQAGEFAIPSTTRRRFSNVSDAVQRKLSNWRNPSLPTEEIVTQGKSLCGQYIRSRLKRSGFFNKKLTLTRLRSVIGTTTGATVREVIPRLVAVGVELERMHPKVFVNVARQAGRAILVNDKTVHLLYVSIASQIMKSGDMTWGKVVAIFCVAGGLAVDCVKQGRPEYLTKIVDGVEEILENELAHWVAQNGGWGGLNVHFRSPEPGFTIMECLGMVAVFLTSVLVLAFILKWWGNTAF
ncbi:bcl-2-related ovarian killer protein-like [Chrysoperla carnea]|uniref:bcl-2-related ovarian killer protein-like n=1 Tax=Chrysoperla carnea TaxID=189513 RepID=UPI001D07A0E5|nr:bcl-2-related ovarian killer protein-like [Chrysoperla carnea]XP_044738547.1 bcl-2-related ovarian killer protein-like [Chrysoperla carnea]